MSVPAWRRIEDLGKMTGRFEDKQQKKYKEKAEMKIIQKSPKILRCSSFLAPTGAQEVALSVCLSVCVSVRLSLL